ncbi:hypothetical protein Mapa_005526 [Marchantia paleacea]|nr:hypothetical protein Mapa_005526 [Marchantia paleacea]
MKFCERISSFHLLHTVRHLKRVEKESLVNTLSTRSSGSDDHKFAFKTFLSSTTPPLPLGLRKYIVQEKGDYESWSVIDPPRAREQLPS